LFKCGTSTMLVSALQKHEIGRCSSQIARALLISTRTLPTSLTPRPCGTKYYSIWSSWRWTLTTPCQRE